MPQERKIIEISTGTIMRTILVVLLLVFLYFVRDIVAVVLFSIVVASAVDPFASWFEERKIPRLLGVIFVYLIAFSILAGLFYIIIPPLFSEISSFTSDAATKLQNSLDSDFLYGILPEKFPITLSGLMARSLGAIQGYISEFTTGFFGATAAVFGGALSFLLIIILSFYLAVQKKGIENFLRTITPIKHEAYILDLWARSRRKIGRWLQSQILLGVLVGVLVFLGLTFLRVKYAFILALLSAVFELIPLFGPVISAIPAIAIAFLQKPILGLIVLIFYVIVQQFENNLIYPVVVRKTIGVPPIIVIIAIIVGAKLGGFFGILLAVPIATVLMEVFNDLASRKQIKNS